ncbi:MAG: hypothetical protein ACYDEV_04810 [Acidiferrobacter sp.]
MVRVVLRRLGLGVVASGLLFTTWAAHARMNTDQGIVAYDNNLSLSFVHRHVGYGERLAPPQGPYFDTESGFLNGGRMAISGMGSDGVRNVYFHLSYTQTTGTLTYVGGINGTNTSLVESTHAHMTDIGVRLGQGFGVADEMMLVPYVAYGSHHWGRGQSAGVTNPSDYYESYRNEYVGAGILWQAEPIRHFITTVNLAYGRTVHPTITAPALGFAEGLGPKPWRRAGISLDYLVDRHESVFASAVFTQFQYGAGPVVAVAGGYGNEPFSQTEIIDYNVGARFLF